MVTVRLVLMGAGSINDPTGMPGVAGMTADLLTQGTVSRSARQIAEAIDFVGGALSANADNDGACLSVSVVKKEFPTAQTQGSLVFTHGRRRRYASQVSGHSGR